MKTIDDLANFIESKINNVNKVVVKAQNIVAKKIYNDVITNAPGTGLYRDSIKIYPTEINGDEISTFIGSSLTVGPAKSNGKSYNLGYLLEHGTMPHDIYPIDSSSLRFEIDGEEIFTKHVHHPGTVAQPHYRIALEKNKKFYKDNIKEAWRGR